MNETISRETVVTITQSILAVVIVLGGGLIFASASIIENKEAITGLVGVVLGYYFSGTPFDGTISASITKAANGVSQKINGNGNHETKPEVKG